MQTYLNLLKAVLEKGSTRKDRTGVGTLSLFGYQMRIHLAEGFPLLTTKQVHLKAIIHELLWFLKGETHIDYLTKHGVHIWDEWADAEGNLGPIYGAQWRAWEGQNGKRIDQIQQLIQQIKTQPDSRRLLVSAWNVGALEYMALPPCHSFFQCYVSEGKLSCQLYQRSADVFLGVPFNIASYALLVQMIAQVCHLEVGELIHTFGDVHLYLNHVDQATLQLSRKPKPLPRMILNPEIKSIFDFQYSDFRCEGYHADPAIPAPIAV